LNNIQLRRAVSLAAPAAALTILTCLFSHLGAMGLAGPDEPRYAWIARSMATSGDWVTPRLYGQPWFEKPILHYWLGALGFNLNAPAEWAARLPSALAALAAALAIAWFAWKHYGIEEDLAGSPVVLAPLIFSTTVAAVGFARAATPDMLFSACLALAMVQRSRHPAPCRLPACQSRSNSRHLSARRNVAPILRRNARTRRTC